MFHKTTRILITMLVIYLITQTTNASSAQEPTNYTSYIPLITYTRSGWIGPWGGFIVSIAIDLTNPQVVYAGTWGSGVYKSLDGGEKWQPASYGLENPYINSLAIDPTATNVLFAGTYKNQVYKSNDGGKTWYWSGAGMQEQAVVYSLIVDPINPANVYAATRGISNNGNPPWSGIVYQSTDGGRTWQPVLENVGGEDVQDWVYSIAILPNQNNNIYVATHENGPFRSNDYAATWFPIHDGINDDSGRAIVTSPETPNGTALYYGVWHFDTVYKSMDGGNDWYPANRGIGFLKVYSIAIDPVQIDNVYLGTFTNGIMKTMDGGESWKEAGLQQNHIYALAIDPAAHQQILAGTAGDGVYKSTDGGGSWQHSNQGINNSMVTKVIINTPRMDTLITSVYGGGVYKSEDMGGSWSELNTGLEDKSVHTLVQNPSSPEQLYALTDTGGLFRNNLNNDVGWEKIDLGLPGEKTTAPGYSIAHPFATREMVVGELSNAESIALQQQTSENLFSMAFAGSDPQIVYLGTGGSGVYKSENGGTTWKPTGLISETIQSVAVDPIDPNLVYAASTASGGLYISQDGGVTWDEGNLGVVFYSLATAEAMPGIALAGTSDGIYRFQNGEFTQLGLSGMAVTAVTVDPTHPERVLAGTTSGAYISGDSGQNWKLVDWNLRNLSIRSIDLDPANTNEVYFSTQTHGIYTTRIEE